MLAGERDRDRAVALLREHFAEGRLTLEQLGRRVERVLHARSRWQIGLSVALFGSLLAIAQGLLTGPIIARILSLIHI